MIEYFKELHSRLIKIKVLCYLHSNDTNNILNTCKMLNFRRKYAVNAVLLKLRPKLYQSRYNPSPMNNKQDTIHTAKIPSLPLPPGAISLAISVNMDTSNQLINVSNRTQSTRLQSHELSTPSAMS